MNATLEHSHAQKSLAERVNSRAPHSYLRDFVYGAIDGPVTTFSVVSGVSGVVLNPKSVIVLGLANLVGDGFSMAASNYLGTKTEQQVRDKARAMDQRHIRITPKGESDEVRQIYAAKGFEGSDLERAVEVASSKELRWVDTILVDELGISLEGPSAFIAAVTTFMAFCLVGFGAVAAGIAYAVGTLLKGIVGT